MILSAVLDAAAFHGHHFDVAANPVWRTELQVAELDVLAGDVAADTFANRAIGRFDCEVIEGFFIDFRVFF